MKPAIRGDIQAPPPPPTSSSRDGHRDNENLHSLRERPANVVASIPAAVSTASGPCASAMWAIKQCHPGSENVAPNLDCCNCTVVGEEEANLFPSTISHDHRYHAQKKSLLLPASASSLQHPTAYCSMAPQPAGENMVNNVSSERVDDYRNCGRADSTGGTGPQLLIRSSVASSFNNETNAALQTALSSMKKVRGEPEAVKRRSSMVAGESERCIMTSSEPRTMSMRERGRWASKNMGGYGYVMPVSKLAQQQQHSKFASVLKNAAAPAPLPSSSSPSSSACTLSSAAATSTPHDKIVATGESTAQHNPPPTQQRCCVQCLHCGSFSTTPVPAAATKLQSGRSKVKDYSWQQEKLVGKEAIQPQPPRLASVSPLPADHQGVRCTDYKPEQPNKHPARAEYLDLQHQCQSCGTHRHTLIIPEEEEPTGSWEQEQEQLRIMYAQELDAPLHAGRPNECEANCGNLWSCNGHCTSAHTPPSTCHCAASNCHVMRSPRPCCRRYHYHQYHVRRACCCSSRSSCSSFRETGHSHHHAINSRPLMQQQELDTFSGPIGYVSDNNVAALQVMMMRQKEEEEDEQLGKSNRSSSRRWRWWPGGSTAKLQLAAEHAAKVNASSNSSTSSTATASANNKLKASTVQCEECGQRLWVHGRQEEWCEGEVGGKLCGACLKVAGGIGGASGTAHGPSPPGLAPTPAPPRHPTRDVDLGCKSSTPRPHHQYHYYPRPSNKKWRLVKLCRYMLGFP